MFLLAPPSTLRPPPQNLAGKASSTDDAELVRCSCFNCTYLGDYGIHDALAELEPQNA